MLIKDVKKLSQAKVKELLANDTISKSSKIKELFLAGYTVKQISDLMNIRYNFAYNVISNFIVINELDIVKEEKINKKDLVLSQYKEGKTIKEISINLKTNYNYVHKIVKEYKLSIAE